MEQQATVGFNRTGADMAPMEVEELESFAVSRLGQGRRDGEEIAAMREMYVREADPVGCVPVPGMAEGMDETDASPLEGGEPSLLVDKLGERLAFERSGIRLYEAFAMKCAAVANRAQTDEFEVPLDRLAAIQADEEAHFELLTDTLSSLGADPTAMTPSADVCGVMAMGWLQVISDPRTTIAQALNAMLSAELTDSASWELLIELANAAGHDELAETFATPAESEQRHLLQVREWLKEALLAESK
jgi:rubrerythrin